MGHPALPLVQVQTVKGLCGVVLPDVNLYVGVLPGADRDALGAHIKEVEPVIDADEEVALFGAKDLAGVKV